jgi:hypothetical protein
MATLCMAEGWMRDGRMSGCGRVGEEVTRAIEDEETRTGELKRQGADKGDWRQRSRLTLSPRLHRRHLRPLLQGRQALLEQNKGRRALLCPSTTRLSRKGRRGERDQLGIERPSLALASYVRSGSEQSLEPWRTWAA